MADFPSAVNPPGGVNYAAPLMNFSNFSNWAADDPYKKIFDQQAQPRLKRPTSIGLLEERFRARRGGLLLRRDDALLVRRDDVPHERAQLILAGLDRDADEVAVLREIAEDREVVLGGRYSGSEVNQQWVIEDADGMPTNITVEE